MRKEHKPLLLLKLLHWLNRNYVKRKVHPQFDQLGKQLHILHPRHLKIFGHNIFAGDYLQIICEKHKPVSLTCWSSKQEQGQIQIGDYCLISPGVTIASATGISIGDNCMLAADVYISDCDWHGIYNRTRPFRCSKPIKLEDNVWVGLRAIINKGVTVGENSVIAAGAVVVEDVPANTVVGGNPAKVIKQINPNRRMLKREYLFQHQDYWHNQNQLQEYLTGNNSWRKWLKSLFSPKTKD